MTNTNSTNSTQAAFLTEFFARSSAPICLASYANKKSEAKLFPPADAYTRDDARIDKFVARHDIAGRGVYFGVNTVKEGEKRCKASTAEIVCLHGDIDFSGVIESREVIEELIGALPLVPSYTNFSGHGLHLY